MATSSPNPFESVPTENSSLEEGNMGNLENMGNSNAGEVNSLPDGQAAPAAPAEPPPAAPAPAEPPAPAANTPPPSAPDTPPAANTPPPAANTPPPAPAPPAPAPPAPAINKPTEPLVIPARKGQGTRSTKQRASDAGAKEMMKMMREKYDKEFADLPEKFRPKPKAYVARAAFYKAEGAERDEYIQKWILADRDAAAARMAGKKPAKKAAPPPSNMNNVATRNLPHLISLSKTRKITFNGVANPLRAHADKVGNKLLAFTKKTETALLEKAPDSHTRSAARHLGAEMKRQVAVLTKEVKYQAANLEKAARHQVREEAMKAMKDLEKQAAANLTLARSGVKPPHNLTRRLARERNAGRAVTASDFLRRLEERGRYLAPHRRGHASKKKRPAPPAPTPELAATPASSVNNTGMPLNSYNA